MDAIAREDAFAIALATRDFMQKGRVWIREPRLEGRPRRLLHLLAQMIDHLGMERVLANEFKWDSGTTPEPDDGIIYKHPEDMTDETAARTGVRPDHKVLLHARLRSRDLFRGRGWWGPMSGEFFDLAEETLELTARHLQPYHDELRRICPTLMGFERNPEECVVRVMWYLDFRRDEPAHAHKIGNGGRPQVGKTHTDRAVETVPLDETHPGYTEYEDGSGNSPGTVLRPLTGAKRWFAGKLLQEETGGQIPASWHGATHLNPEDGRRGVVIYFGHFQRLSRSAVLQTAAK